MTPPVNFPNAPSADIAERQAAIAHAWLITDSAAGNESQVRALASAMGLDTTLRRIHLRAPWRWFAPRLVSASHWALASAQRREFVSPWPQFAIGCGRQAALLTRALRAWSGGATFTVQILDPRIDPALFDVVIAPNHDGLGAANAIRTLGALNPVDDAWLARAAAEFSTLQQLPQPRTALLVGGPHRELSLDAAWLDGLVSRLESLLGHGGGSLMIALSRRTPPAWASRLRSVFRSSCVHFWGGVQDGVNPYAGYLAHADRVVVTPDSVNMLSEACAIGKPVLSYLPQAARGKLADFHTALRAQGRCHDLGDAEISTLPLLPPLRETAAVAAQVWQRYQAHGPPHSAR